MSNSNNAEPGAGSARMTQMGYAQEVNSEALDPEIAPVVHFLVGHGFETFESCQGGPGHCFPDPTVRFHGTEFDAIRAYELCQAKGLLILCVRRVFQKEDILSKPKDRYPHGYVWRRPFNEIVFLKHAQTGTIFLPGFA